MKRPQDKPSRLRVLVIGGGAAGTAAAWGLCQSPSKFEVSLWECSPSSLGGVATTEDLVLPDGTNVRVNDGVQGGAKSYRNTLAIHQSLGFVPQPVEMTVRFGTGGYGWGNTGAPTELVNRLRPEITRFGNALKWINKLNFIFAFVPIRSAMKLWRFSQDFTERMVYPLTALFFGTGNKTPEVSAAIIARVFLDPQLRLFDYDSTRLLSQTPAMFAFQPLKDIYSAFQTDLTSKGAAVHLGRKVAAVCREVQLKKMVVTAVDSLGVAETFDKVIFACPADVALRLLGSGATWSEKRVLGSVKYYDDVTITHCDHEYMKQYYDMTTRDPSSGPFEAFTEQQDRSDYFIRTDVTNPEELEMAFDLGHYQPSIRADATIHFPIYQTIFLNKTSCEKRWTLAQIDKSKILLEKWWHAFSHEVSHFRHVVPWTWLIQGGCRNSTFYCGSWLLVNTHEIAVISGLAVAHRLGAPYPFKEDPLAFSQFATFLSVAHWMKPS